MGNLESKGTWVEPLLCRNLRRTTAPPELWDRVALPRVEIRRRQTVPRFLWTVAALTASMLFVLAVAWGYYPGRRIEPHGNAAMRTVGPAPVQMLGVKVIREARGDRENAACLGCHTSTPI